jgi:hypothetical protein
MGLLRVGFDLARLLDRVRSDPVRVIEDPAYGADRRRAERAASHHLPGCGRRELVAVLDRVHAGEDRGADAVRADRVGRHGEVPLVRLAHAGFELLGGEGAERGRDARREDPARRDQLDRRRAAADLLADGGADAVGAVDLAGERDVVAVAARDREGAPGRQDPRPRDEAGRHGPCHVDARAPHPTQIAHRGHAGVEVPLRVDHGLDRGEPG